MSTFSTVIGTQISFIFTTHTLGSDVTVQVTPKITVVFRAIKMTRGQLDDTPTESHEMKEKTTRSIQRTQTPPRL